MYLDKGYWNAMDKKAMEQYLINPATIGITTPPFEKQLNALKSRIFQGAANVELGFMGKGKGSISGGNITPGMHSKEEREEMRQLAKVNDVSVTTHASPNAGSLAGLSRGGTFDEAEREKSVIEIKRAIDFAADVAEGGPVVIHTGEFARPIYGTEEGRLKEKFEAYPFEKERRTHYLVDERTGKVFEGVRENETIFIPRWKKDKNGNFIQRTGADGEPMIIKNPLINKEEPVYLSETDERGNIIVDRYTYQEYKEKLMKEGIPEKQVPLWFFWELRKRDMESQMGQADEYEIHYRDAQEAMKALKKLRKTFEELESAASEEGLERLKMKAHNKAIMYLEGESHELAPKKFKKPTELIDRAIWKASKNMSYGQEIATSARRQLEKINEMVKDAKLIDDYAIGKSTDSIARAAMYAYEKEKKEKLEKPLFVAPENVFPEQYGAHPDELKNLIVKSREVMAKKLIEQKKMSESEAKKTAETHIRATLDVGHLNTWRKYFTGSDEDFKKWILDKTKVLISEGIIDHIHLSDNFGYEDEHVSPGEGNAPIKEFVEELRKQGYKGKFIVEPGAQDKGRDWQALTTAMRHFNSPVYEIDGDTVGWAKIEHGYFGRVKAGPSYVVGAYAPDVGLPTEHRTWTFWSGMPME